jgi:uncharacterized protein
MTAATLRRQPLGAPGLYWPPPDPVRALTGVRMDVCAFVGVAPRGPARVPAFDMSSSAIPQVDGRSVTHSVATVVDSWSEYERRYGSFEGPGLLPYAVASFFENGGDRAYIVRIVHDYGDAQQNALGVATAVVPLLFAESTAGDFEIRLRARDEGDWGNKLKASIGFRAKALALPSSAFTSTGIVFERGLDIVAGATLRLDHGSGWQSLARVARTWEEWHPDRAMMERHASFDANVTLPVVAAELVEADLEVIDTRGRNERHEHLGLTPAHPRWIARVLVNESQLLYPANSPGTGPGDEERTWYDRDIIIDASLPTYEAEEFLGGLDRYRDLVPSDFFDNRWTPADDSPGRGVHAITHLADVSLLVVPDLYSPRPLPIFEEVLDESGAGAQFCECVDIQPPGAQTAPPEALDGLRLDPVIDLAEIVALQRRLIDLVDALESFVVLLDVPPGLSQRAILRWREQCHSMYAAAYHPWLLVSHAEEKRRRPVRIPPSSVASGIIARRERMHGVQYGPANEIAAGVFDVAEVVTASRHDELHPNAINVYLRERDGIRLSAARTLSADPRYRQLSVRRLMTMLRRVLYQQMQWAVFEPNTSQLRDNIKNQLDAFLRQLFAANAFAGARAEEAYFVRCDDEINSQAIVDQGRLLAYVGVAPAEPLEFLMLQIARGGDGTLRLQG